MKLYRFRNDQPGRGAYRKGWGLHLLVIFSVIVLLVASATYVKVVDASEYSSLSAALLVKPISEFTTDLRSQGKDISQQECGNDTYEPDNDSSSAKPISTDGMPQSHNNHPATEEDWVIFHAIEGDQYEIGTRLTNDINQGDTAANDTYLYLYAPNGTTLLASNDDVGDFNWYMGYYHYRESLITWTAPSTGDYYVRELQWGPTLGHVVRDCHTYDMWVIDMTTTPVLALSKTSTTTSVTFAGQVVPYQYLLTNNTPSTLNGIILNDNKTVPVCPQTTLVAGGSMVCTASYTVTQADMNAGGVLRNTVNARYDPDIVITTHLDIPIIPPDTATPTDTITPTSTPTPSVTPTDTPTFTLTPSNTPTLTSSPTPSDTPTDTPTFTLTPSSTPSPTPTSTPTPSDTPTDTPTFTLTPSNTPTPTSTSTPTPSDTPTDTPTFTLTPSSTPTQTSSPTPSDTPTDTPTFTLTPSRTATYTFTPTSTATPFDPPFGWKTVDASGLPVLAWKMVWINGSNKVPINASVSDPIPVGTAYVTGSLSCTPASLLTTTTVCQYEIPSILYPRGRVLWVGTIGPDFGATDAASAQNELYITFRVTKNSGVNSVQNKATMDADLNGDGDLTDPGDLNVAAASASWTRPPNPTSTPALSGLIIPNTGFAPNRVTILPIQTTLYSDLGDLWLEIPRLGVQMPIVGVPLVNGTWDVSWLGNDAGWLNGSAYPTWNGNSVLTGHVTDASGNPGPFSKLSTLWWGDEVIVHASGVQYVYEVRSVIQAAPGNINTLMKHETLPWVTLVTCRGYDISSDSYLYRLLVRAVLVEIR